MTTTLALPELIAEQLDQTPTLWAAPDLRSIIRPLHELGYRRRDLVQVEAGRERVYRWLDRYWLGWLGAAYAKAERQHHSGTIDQPRWDALAARWATITAWATEHHSADYVAHCTACPPPADYPAPSARDRFSDRLVSWRSRHTELPS